MPSNISRTAAAALASSVAPAGFAPWAAPGSETGISCPQSNICNSSWHIKTIWTSGAYRFCDGLWAGGFEHRLGSVIKLSVGYIFDHDRVADSGREDKAAHATAVFLVAGGGVEQPIDGQPQRGQRAVGKDQFFDAACLGFGD